MAVDLNRMQIFKQVVALGSFSKAATVLHQPKSRISRNISSLERELGVQLIYRTTRQFRLTEAGKDLYNRSVSPLNELAFALENINRFSDQLSGKLHVTAPEDLGVELMAGVCRDFMRLHPQVHVDLHLTSQMLDLVKDGIDVAVRIGQLKDSSLRQAKIGVVKMGIFLNPTLRAGLRQLEDLQKLPFLAFSHLDFGKSKFSNGRVDKILNFKSVFASNNLLVLRGLAAQGVGFAQLPEFLLATELKNGTLIQVFSEWKLPVAPIQLLTPQQKEPLPRCAQLCRIHHAAVGPPFLGDSN